MRVRYQHWVEGLNGDWLISRQRFFGIPFPVWYRLDADGNPNYDELLLATRRPAARRPVERAARRLRRGPARQARRLHRRPRRDGHLGHVVAHTADRVRLGRRSRPVLAHVPDGPPPAGSRDHPHVAVRHRRPLALRAPRASVDRHHDQRLDPRPRPQEDVEEQGQRRHADEVARRLRVRRGALLVGAGAARRRHRVRRRRDEDRAPAGDEDPQRVEVRARRDGRRRARARRRRRAGRPVDARGAARSGRRRDAFVRRLRLRAGARADRAVLLGLLRRLPRAGEATVPTARSATTAPGRRAPRSRSRCPRCCGCSRRTCRS